MVRFISFKYHGTDPGEAKGAALDISDFVAGEAFVETDDGIDHLMEAIENGDGYEGDMVLTKEQLEGQQTRSALFDNSKKWPMAGGHPTVPYVISRSFSATERSQISKAIADYESKTCLR